MERQLKARIGAASLMLQRPGLSEDVRRSISRVQAKAIKEIVSKDVRLSSLSAEAIAEVQEKAATCPWEGSDLDFVLSVLTPPSDSSDGGKTTRREMQTFAPSLLSYFTQEEWLVLLGEGTAPGDRVDLVFRRASQLTGRTLAEPTLKMLSSFLMLLESPDAANWMTREKTTFSWLSSRASSASCGICRSQKAL